MKYIPSFFAFLFLINFNLFSQKIVVKFKENLKDTPSVSKAILRFNKDFAYSFTLDDATDDAFTTVFPLFKGGIIKPINLKTTGLFFTDGCGNDVPFRAGVAWNTAGQAGDIHGGDVAGFLTWRQLDTLLEGGWDVFNHSFSHKSRSTSPMKRADYETEIDRNRLFVKQKTVKKIEMPVFVVPSGDTTYQNIALDLGHKIVFDQPETYTGLGGFNVDGNLNLKRLKIHRQLLEESISTSHQLEKVSEKSKNGTHFWYNEFTHRVDNFKNTEGFNFFVFKNYMEKLALTHGKKGSDRAWVASLQEVFEYLVMRQSVVFTTKMVGKTVEISFDLKQVPAWLKRRNLTLIVDSKNDFMDVEVPIGVIKTFKGVGNLKIINLSF